MALYHFQVEQIKRSEGRTAVASAAYRAGEKLHNLWDGEIHDYTKKGGVILAEIILLEHAPQRFSDRSTLWNEVEQVEKHYKAQLAYSFDMALQNEFSLEENIELAKEFVRKYFVSDGMICNLAVHQPDREEGGIPNPHFHVLVPIRPLNDDGTWGVKQHRVYHFYLAQLLSEAYTMRNQTAMTYARGKTKAKKNNLKRFMDECYYLKQRDVLTLSDFEKYLSSVDEKVEARKSSMNQKQTRLKELQQLMEDALYMTCGDREWGAEVYGCASDRQQASIVFDVVVDMVDQCPALKKRIKPVMSVKRLVYLPTNSFYQVLSAEAYTKHGLNVHAVIFDELHSQPNRELFDVMTKGSGDARTQPLFFLITTAGNIKPDKEKSTEKIDGAVAAIMALDREIRYGVSTGSMYDERGILSF